MNYRLKFVETDGIETISDKTWLIEPISIKAKEIVREKNLILRLRGLQTYHLKKMNYGQPCTDCFDEIMSMQVDGNCTTCYNTRFIGGYYSPVSTKAFMTQTPDINTINRFGEFNPGQVIYSISAYPELF